MHNENYLKWFDKHGKKRPDHFPHGVDSEDEPISKKLKRLKTHSWRLQGNELIADTDMGKLVQIIPTDYICVGTDDEGLPLLQKIKL